MQMWFNILIFVWREPFVMTSRTERVFEMKYIYMQRICFEGTETTQKK